MFDGTLVQSIQRRRCELWTRFYPRRTLTAINRDGSLRFLRANWLTTVVYIIIYYTLLKVVSHYDLGVVHASDGFPKKNVWIGDASGGASSNHFFWNVFNFAKPLSALAIHLLTTIYCMYLPHIIWSAFVNHVSLLLTWKCKRVYYVTHRYKRSDNNNITQIVTNTSYRMLSDFFDLRLKIWLNIFEDDTRQNL